MANGLRALRVSRGFTHAEAAQRMGLSRGQFIKLERGERQLTERTIRLAAVAFDATTYEILAPETPRRKTSP